MQKNNAAISFPVIAAAANGDVDAINAVLKRYEGYIARLSTRMLYDADGNTYMVVDEEMRRRLETKLITKILKFKIA
ncbi:MAG: helix-turn-helix domain-containing protein [Eubacteriales bacterium]|nr:helix-turn-helix domain-containing protein [Eubacteriales bacterium]